MFEKYVAQVAIWLEIIMGITLKVLPQCVALAWYGGYLGDGTKPAVLHFTKEGLPPAKLFWSATLYTLPDRFLYANPINRYSIGDRTKDLVYGRDGPLDIYLSNTSPGKDKESNWLPTPLAKYSLAVRCYGPSQAAMTGVWKLPPATTSQSISSIFLPKTAPAFLTAQDAPNLRNRGLMV
jgi:Protein of unknown function (DUF1214)